MRISIDSTDTHRRPQRTYTRMVLGNDEQKRQDDRACRQKIQPGDSQSKGTHLLTPRETLLPRLHASGPESQSVPNRDTNRRQATHRRRPLPATSALQENYTHLEKPRRRRATQTPGPQAKERRSSGPIQKGTKGHLECSEGHRLLLHGR